MPLALMRFRQSMITSVIGGLSVQYTRIGFAKKTAAVGRIEQIDF